MILVNKAFIIWFSGKFFQWDMAGSPVQARYSVLCKDCSVCKKLKDGFFDLCHSHLGTPF